jgi:uncharacterized protein YndB with AHSA1/START domain
VHITRTFDAPRQRVWDCWTKSELLDQWWAPLPWKAVTHSMDFRAGGTWYYYMQGPEGERHYCRNDYLTIDAPNSYSGIDAFCDENGQAKTDLPGMQWMNTFHSTPTGTRVEIEITFASEADMNTIFEMGFQEGFSMAHDNLDALLAA